MKRNYIAALMMVLGTFMMIGSGLLYVGSDILLSYKIGFSIISVAILMFGAVIYTNNIQDNHIVAEYVGINKHGLVSVIKFTDGTEHKYDEKDVVKWIHVDLYEGYGK
jgi:hypothetical protein